MGEEYLRLEIQYEADRVAGVILGADEWAAQPDGSFFFEDWFIADLCMGDWPVGVPFVVVEDHLELFPHDIVKVDEASVKVTVREELTEWTGGCVEEARKMAEDIKLALDEERARVGDVLYLGTEEHEDVLWVNYEITTTADGSARDVYVRLRNRNDEVRGLASDIANGVAPRTNCYVSEERFTQEIVLPLLRACGFSDIRYSHGRDEYGRDITFSEVTRLGLRRNYAVQVKCGDVSGEANSMLDKLIAQVEDAFSMPYTDTTSREGRRVTDMLIVISGHYTHNAREKIGEKTRGRNVYFLDIDKVLELRSRRSEYGS